MIMEGFNPELVGRNEFSDYVHADGTVTVVFVKGGVVTAYAPTEASKLRLLHCIIKGTFDGSLEILRVGLVNHYRRVES